MPAMSRRLWLERAALVSAAFGWASRVNAQGLDRFVTPGVPCVANPALTPAADVGADFKPGAPARRTLVEPEPAATAVNLSGTVSGLTCGRIKGARIDLWQADSRGAIDLQGFRLRGHQLTDADGRYAFQTIVPGPARGRAPRLNLRIEVPRDRTLKPGQNGTFMTALFFPGDVRNAADPLFRSELVMKSGPAAGAAPNYLFDVILDL
jgi:protocatechuate 3,4-dioxygenase beta subunit